MVKILLADDHPAIRTGLRNILSTQFNPVEFGEAANSAEALHQIYHAKWDMVILDVNLPGRSGMDVLKYIQDERLSIPVLVFSFHSEEQIAVRALQSGAAGYLTKDATSTELLSAVQLLLAGRKYISPLVSEMLVSQLNNPLNKKPHELLSNREYQTMILLATGSSLSQIAEELSVSPSAVNTYRARLLEKMNMKNNAELIRYALDNELI